MLNEKNMRETETERKNVSVYAVPCPDINNGILYTVNGLLDGIAIVCPP